MNSSFPLFHSSINHYLLTPISSSSFLGNMSTRTPVMPAGIAVAIMACTRSFLETERSNSGRTSLFHPVRHSRSLFHIAVEIHPRWGRLASMGRQLLLDMEQREKRRIPDPMIWYKGCSHVMWPPFAVAVLLARRPSLEQGAVKRLQHTLCDTAESLLSANAWLATPVCRGDILRRSQIALSAMLAPVGSCRN